MSRKVFFKITSKKVRFLILIVLAISVFAGSIIYLTKQTRKANSKYESILDNYKSEVKKIMFHQTSQRALHDISSKFYDLSESLFLPRTLKTDSKNYMDFTKYLAYRENLYQNLLNLTSSKSSMRKPLPNQFKNLIDELNHDLTMMSDLYNQSLFIRNKVIISPSSIKAFVISFCEKLSTSTEQELIEMLNSNFNKMLSPPVTDTPTSDKVALSSLPPVEPNERDLKYMKDLHSHSSYYSESLDKTNKYLNKDTLTEDCDISVINNHFKTWNSFLNTLWATLQEHLPPANLSKAEYSQLNWIKSKTSKTKFEQVHMTKNRVSEILNHYIYQTNI